MRISIQYKLALILIVLFLSIILGIYLYLDKNLTENSYKRIKENIIKEAILVSEIFQEEKIERANLPELDSKADKLSSQLGVRITIIDTSGRVVGDSDIMRGNITEMENHLYRPEVQDAFQGSIGVSRRFSTTIQKDMLYVAVPIEKDRIIGVSRLSLSLPEVEHISDRLKGILVVAVIFSSILIFLGIFAVSIFVSRPLREMSKAAKDLAKGNFDNRIFYRHNDEVGDLAEAFNEMSGEIRKKIDEITLNKTKLETVLLSMFDGVMVIDISGNILLMNETLRREFLIGKDPSGKKPLELIRNIEVQEMVDNILSGKQEIISEELSIILPEEKIFHVHATQIRHDGMLEGAVLLFHDITELRKLENIRKDFVANVSHELRTPVSNIKGYSETLIDGAINDSENASEFIRIIYADANRLENLITDLLDLSRLESGKLNLSLQKIKVKEFMMRIVSEMENIASEKGIKINIDIPEGLPDINADPVRLRQCFTNLIDNAIKYTQEDGKIQVAAGTGEGCVDISIADNGPGIAEEHLSRIFERFYRADKARSKDLGGTGLGLSIVKHIVNEHDGNVEVKSIQGQGTTFIVSIPVRNG